MLRANQIARITSDFKMGVIKRRIQLCHKLKGLFFMFVERLGILLSYYH